MDQGRRLWPLGLLFRTRQDGYLQTEHVVAFLRDLHYHFRGRIIVVWDGWKIHQAAAKLVQSKRSRSRCPATHPR